MVQTGRKATNPFITVGKNGGNATSEVEAKQAEANNLVCQAKASQEEADALAAAEEKPTGSVGKASSQRSFNFDGRNGDGDGDVFQFVDSHTTVNDLKNDIDDYFQPIYSKLEKLNLIDRHGVTQRCIGTCRMAGRSSFDDKPAKNQKARTQTNKHYKDKRRKLCPDSGTTSHMFTHESDLGDDY